jgi:hypothetical protein
MQPIAGNFLVRGDELHVYFGGARCTHLGTNLSHLDEVTMLAVMRRDGFASLSSPPSKPSADRRWRQGRLGRLWARIWPAPSRAPPAAPMAEVLTRAVVFRKGSHLFVNVEALGADGRLRVAILDHQRRVVITRPSSPSLPETPSAHTVQCITPSTFRPYESLMKALHLPPSRNPSAHIEASRHQSVFDHKCLLSSLCVFHSPCASPSPVTCCSPSHHMSPFPCLCRSHTIHTRIA